MGRDLLAVILLGAAWAISAWAMDWTRPASQSCEQPAPESGSIGPHSGGGQ